LLDVFGAGIASAEIGVRQPALKHTELLVYQSAQFNQSRVSCQFVLLGVAGHHAPPKSDRSISPSSPRRELSKMTASHKRIGTTLLRLKDQRKERMAGSGAFTPGYPCELGAFGSAVEPITRALAVGPEFADVYFTLGLVHTELGQNEKAISAFENSLRLEPDNANAYLLLGCALHQPDTLAEAAAAYQKSLELNPEQFEALLNLGDAYLQLGRVEEARDILTRAGTVNSEDSNLHHSFGELYLKLGMRDEAYRELEVLRRLDPSLADALAKLLFVPPNAVAGRLDWQGPSAS
jgi:tetratricopeptide (TPR) repeat protein